MAPGRIMALDVGNRRIGIAITDALQLTAQPFFTLRRTTLHADLKSIGRFIRNNEVYALVVGDPLHADGTTSRQSEKSALFAQALFAAHPSLEHHMLDERYTTLDAHELLDASYRRAGTRDRLARKDIIDQVAATLLLRAFLERRNGPSLLPDPDGGAADGLEGERP